MMGEKIEFKTEDGMILHGNLYKHANHSDLVVVHITGSGNSSQNSDFTKSLSDIYANNAIDFFTFDRRIWDYSGERPKCIANGAFEKNKEAMRDIDGAINYVKNLGYRHIILEGHSLGSDYAINYLNLKENKEIEQLVLLSPVDHIATLNGNVPKDILNQRKKESIELMELGFPNHMVWNDNDNHYSAQSYLENFANPNDYYLLNTCGCLSFLNYRDNGYTPKLQNIKIPTLVIIGEEDNAIKMSTRSNKTHIELEDIQNYYHQNLDLCDVEFISGANHTFKDYLPELATSIEDNVLSSDQLKLVK